MSIKCFIHSVLKIFYRLKKIQEKKEIQKEKDAKAKEAWGIAQGDISKKYGESIMTF